MIIQVTPAVIALVGLLMYLLFKPAASPAPRAAIIGLVLFIIGSVFLVANLTGHAILR